ncbi:pilus assembly protein [Aeoliella sp. ICT_H6.2]|uniref:Pilus assembly protein n=1 Tax=Aeoliella straminimaris TaxID=2954799 RepID=A0A9X2FGN3_9BACT|nr:TadE/TadG family type IV pilus assembly protein [Aeoliella straminimaris]MCO6045336.1 pilus assembly protein [Aeoliella straminimaris]
MRRRHRALRSGVAAVEFAIVAPVFFLLVIGFVELGRGLMVQQVLTNASRVGVREAIGLHSTQSEAEAVASDYADGCSVSGVVVNVTPDPATASAGTEITVTVSIPYADVSWVPSPWFMGGSTLEATSTMRKEGFE